MRYVLTISILLLLVPHVALAAIFVVNPEGTGDRVTIQDALDDAVNGDSVLLTQGIFRGSGNTNLLIGGKNITLQSQCGDPRGCIIDGEGLANGIDAGGGSATIRGITVRNAHNWGIRTGSGNVVVFNNIVTGTRASTAIGCGGTDLVTGNIITQNQGQNGAGIAVGSGSPTISSNVITYNTAFGGYEGGGIAVNGSPTIVNNVIAYNSAHRGGGIMSWGTATIANNTFIGNEARAGEGGAIYLRNPADLTVRDNIIWDSTPASSAIYLGSGTTLTISHCDLEGGMSAISLYGGTLNWGAGMIDADPVLVSAFDNDYYLQGPTSPSPCIDAGSKTAAATCFTNQSGTVCMDQFVTTTNQVVDAGVLDIGAHFDPLAIAYVPDHHATIQGAIDQVPVYDVVIVRADKYAENINFNGRGIWLLAEDGPTLTIIEGSIDMGFTVIFNSDECHGSILDGFTVTNGPGTDAGGILCDGASPWIRNCVVEGNDATFSAGGIACWNQAAPTIEGNVIRNNQAGSAGGGMNLSSSPARILDNEISDNGAGLGGGIRVSDAIPEIIGNVVANNDADWGGGLYLSGCDTELVLENCTVAKNSALNSGGGIYVTTCPDTIRVTTSTLSSNFAGTSGGGIAVVSSDVVVDRSIIAFSTWGEAVWCDTGSATLRCSDVFGNTGGDYTGCIAGQSGVNNISLNPLFCDIPADDFELASSSPCAEANNPVCGQIGAWGVGCPAPPTLHVVCPDGSGDYTHIQDAINVAQDGEIVELCDAIYTGDRNRDLDTGGLSLTIRSASGDASACILAPQGSSGDPHRAFWFHTGESPTIQDITITGGWGDNGGAILCENLASPTFEGCLFMGNSSSHDGAVMFSRHVSTPNFTDCQFIGNSAGDDGGAITCRDGSDVELSGCTLAENTAADGGGALYVYQASPTVDDCTLYANGAVNGGGIASQTGSTVTVQNTIIAFGTQGVAVSCGGGAAALSCTDVYGNAGGDWVGCLTGQEAINNNLGADPVFCDASGGDLTLDSSSPCAAANNPACGQIGAWPIGCGGLTYTVCPDGSGDFTTIQAAIDAASGGDTIELCDATYTGLENRDLTFDTKTLTLRSASGNPAACVIDCEADEFDPHRGLTIDGGQGSNTLVAGITITNAWYVGGGGIRIQSSSPTIWNCVFRDCTSSDGGGVFATTGSAPTIISCVFENNHATNAGGGLRFTSSGGSVSGCTFEGNYGYWGGGGTYLYVSDPDFDDCLFVDNSCHQWGSAMQIHEPESTPTITGCTFYGGTSPDGTVFMRGGPTATFENCILAFSAQGMAVSCTSGSATMICCDVYGNAGGDWVGCIVGQGGSNGNLATDPLLCDAPGGYFGLSTGSVCLPSNNTCGVQMGAFGEECNVTSVPETPDVLPTQYVLHGNHPNPFNPSTTIAFDLPGPARVRLIVYAVDGRAVATLTNEVMSAGRHEVVWAGVDDGGRQVASGVYLYRLETEAFDQVKRMVLLK